MVRGAFAATTPVDDQSVLRKVGRVVSRVVESLHGGQEMAGFARHAHAYDFISRRLVSRLHRRGIMDACVIPLPDAALVIDVGTGSGRVPLELARVLPSLRVEGVDLSPQMIAYARHLAKQSRSAATFAVADVAMLPYDDASVDLVISIASAHHWADIDAGIRELHRVLRPGAQAMIYDVRPVVRTAMTSARSIGMRASAQPLRLGFARLTLRP